MKIPYHDILYIETTGVSHKLRIIGKNFCQRVLWNYDRYSGEGQTYPAILLLHKSFLVNVGNVREIDRKNLEVVFYEDHRCPITRLKKFVN